jgi:hypothetical protein
MRIKYMSVEEFREKGYLQEVNRCFLHPLGLALAVRQHEDGPETLEGIWDCRDDPEGLFFTTPIVLSEKATEKADHVEALRMSKLGARLSTGECDSQGRQQLRAGEAEAEKTTPRTAALKGTPE